MWVVRLTSELAKRHTARLLELADLVDAPERHAPEFIWSDVGPDGVRIRGKWEYSLVLFEGEDIIGLVLGYERPADDPGSEARELYTVAELHLALLAVDPTHQGKGYAHVLMYWFIRYAIEAGTFCELKGGIEYVGLTTDAENNPGSLHLYHSFGFREIGRQTRKGVRKVIMRAPLSVIEASSKYQKLELVTGRPK